MKTAVKQFPATRAIHRAGSVIGIIVCLLLSVSLACNLTIIIKGTLQPEKPPSVLGITPMVVLSGSMSGEQEGHLEVGDLIFVTPAQPEELEVGDVIAFMSGQATVTHRITAISAGEDGQLQFTTKGDANHATDTLPVAEDQLVGRYWFRIPKAGDFALFLQQPVGMLLFIGVPLVAFLGYDVFRRQRMTNQQQKKARELEEELARLKGPTPGGNNNT